MSTLSPNVIRSENLLADNAPNDVKERVMVVVILLKRLSKVAGEIIVKRQFKEY